MIAPGVSGQETYKTPRLINKIKLILILSFRCRFQNRIVGNRARKRSLAVFTAMHVSHCHCLSLYTYTYTYTYTRRLTG